MAESFKQELSPNLLSITGRENAKAFEKREKELVPLEVVVRTMEKHMPGLLDPKEVREKRAAADALYDAHQRAEAEGQPLRGGRTKNKRRKPAAAGRSEGTAEGNPKVRFSIRFDPELLEVMKTVASRHHTTVPRVIDAILRGWREEGQNRYL
jgi:hypothetical protein